MTKSIFARGLAAAAALLIAAAASSADNNQPAGPRPSDQYVQADAKIAATEIHAFSDQGENVTIALGNFSLAVGGRKVTGRDAVLWVKTDSSRPMERHEITAYVEGDAKVAEPDGSSLSDRTLLVTLRSEGKLSAEGAFSTRPLNDFPLYQHAKEARQKSKTAAKAASAPALHEAPAIVRQEPPVPQPQPAAQAEPEASPQPAEVPAAPAAAPPAKRPSQPAPPKTVYPVNFSADNVSYQLDEQKSRWITVARGNVYLSQGNPDSDLFVELRSQVAVIFTQTAAENKKDTFSPYSPELIGVAGQGKQVVTGVYLEGDVVISRGERVFRGESAYYDFTIDRALVTEPVFRTVQEQRNIPIYIRAREARLLSAREIWFADAKVTSSEFYTPEYHIGAKTAYLMDNTPYNPEGKPLGERAWQSKLTDTTFNIRGVPVFWTPSVQGDLQQGNTPLRKATVGKSGRFGWGVETEWHLFRLLGVVEPEGFKGKFNFDWLERGVIGGIDLDYARRDFSGYDMFYGVVDSEGQDAFGAERKDIPASSLRGRALMRHKQFLPEDWELQFELSYICDRNFMEEFFPDEHFAGKEQETLLYAKKQRDNWAFTSLAKVRINRFDTQSDSYPDLGLYLIGEPLLNDRLTFFSESHAGIKRFQTSNAFLRDLATDQTIPSPLNDYDTGCFTRVDTRQELDLPLHSGPINLVPYAVGRATHWGDRWSDNADVAAERLSLFGSDGTETFRPYGQVGLKTDTHVWGVFDGVDSRLWDLHGLKHIITPEMVLFLAGSNGVTPDDLLPLDPGIEQHLEPTSGAAFNLYQRLQTKRGQPGQQHTSDWMRMNLSLGLYDSNQDNVPADGRFFWYRPENSIARNHLNGEYAWNISDSTALLTDANYDIESGELGKGNVGIAVSRDPRLRYYAGMRYTEAVNSAAGTFGVNYQINRKYSISTFEQYDFKFDDGRNLSTNVTITRKLPRWYAAFTFSHDNSAADNEVTLLVTFWPEGIEEAKIGGGKLALLGGSEKN